MCEKEIAHHLSSVIHITLISENHHLKVSAGVISNFPHPVLDAVEALLVCDVIDDEEPMSIRIVVPGNPLEGFSPVGVPHLKFRLRSVKLYSSSLEFNCRKSNIKSLNENTKVRSVI